ncbi:glycosyltransferase family 4 protein [Cohnella sp. JJ-181]|uniref:glycosyltransferase family 4 protein n=1 Tax=Cohnella rhizoplanae TaxID=2974897 RepID=UPI0022FFAA6C|nr:glycosyltransferase [Cohnella sp. JJ-181]CAI6037010.1 D-inositol-3-phosphate glycosyltransferase [Cohnella sp. JJ-181]
MKVGYYNHTSDVSGAEISLLSMAGHLREDEAVVLGPPGELADRARAGGIQYVEVPGYRPRMTRNPLKLIGHLAGMAAEGRRLARAIRELELDIVHANSIRAGLIVSLFARPKKLPVVWHIRDHMPKGMLGRLVRAVAARSAASLVCISQAVREGTGELARRPARKFAAGKDGRMSRELVAVIHNGVPLEREDGTDRAAEHAADRARIRRELGASPGTAVVTIIGQIAPWKRQEDAIEAVKLLLARGLDVMLWVVGEPKFREENMAYAERLRAMASGAGLAGRVVFTGFRSDIKEICRAADLLVLCSDNEPFGRVLIEAMAEGIPVVGTRAGGVVEIVTEGETGSLYEIGDVPALADRVGALVTDPERRLRMGSAASRRVRENFGISSTVAKVEALYRALRPARPAGPRVAIVHDYLNQMGGAERVVSSLRRMYPDAPIFTTIADPSKLPADLRAADVRTTWMQRIPGVQKRFKLFFWLYPLAVRSMDLTGYDLVVSSSSAYAKGVRVPKGAVHVCYCHTPMRFAWNFDEYVKGMELPAPVRKLSSLMVGPLRRWDAANSDGVDAFIANSSVVQERIREHYGRQAAIVHPPVDTERFAGEAKPAIRTQRQQSSGTKNGVKARAAAGVGDYFLVVSRLVSYKRIDLAVEACSLLGERLIVVGDGPDRERLTRLASPNVTFAGRLPDEEVERLMRGCRALLFPGIEDFGITPLEVNACGRPVIAYREGGAQDTVRQGLNGLFFDKQTRESLARTLLGFHAWNWDAARIREYAASFGEERFEREFRAAVSAALSAREQPAASPAGSRKEAVV